LSAPATIVLAIIFSWSLDSAWLSGRFEGNRKKRMDHRGLVRALGNRALGLACLALVFFKFPVTPGRPHLDGLCITVSALTFLIFISKLRQKAPLGEPAEGLQEERKRHAEMRENDRLAEQSLTLSASCFSAR